MSDQTAAFVAMATKHPEYVENWARLRGVRLPKTPIDRMIDEASGHGSAIAELFLSDALDMASRLPDTAMESDRG